MLFFLCFLEEHLANVVKEESRSDQPFNQKKFTIKSVKRFSLFTFTKINCFFLSKIYCKNFLKDI